MTALIASGSVSEPPIACACVSNGDASDLLRSIALFQKQDYAPKKLYCAVDQSDHACLSVLSSCEDPYVQLLKSDFSIHSRIDLLNQMLSLVDEDYFCLWSVEDWHHPERLSISMGSLQNFFADAVVSLYVLLHNPLNQRSYFSSGQIWESTLLFNRKEILEAGLGFESATLFGVSDIVTFFIKKKRFFPCCAPNMYMLKYRGQDFLREIMANAQRLKPESESVVGQLFEGDFPEAQVAALLSEINYDYQK